MRETNLSTYGTFHAQMGTYEKSGPSRQNTILPSLIESRGKVKNRLKMQRVCEEARSEVNGCTSSSSTRWLDTNPFGCLEPKRMKWRIQFTRSLVWIAFLPFQAALCSKQQKTTNRRRKKRKKSRTRWDSNPQPLGPKPNALSVAPRDHSCTHYVKSLYIRKLHTERTGLLLSFHFLRPKQGNTSLRLQEKKKKALREDRTPDLSLTKRVLYRLSY